MELKQCRVPSTFTLFCDLRRIRICSIDAASRTRSVPYVRFPAQLVNFSFSAHAVRGASTGLAMPAESKLRNVRFFIHAREPDNAAAANPSHNRCHWASALHNEYVRDSATGPLQIFSDSLPTDDRIRLESQDCECDSKRRGSDPILRSTQNASGRDTSSPRPSSRGRAPHPYCRRTD